MDKYEIFQACVKIMLFLPRTSAINVSDTFTLAFTISVMRLVAFVVYKIFEKHKNMLFPTLFSALAFAPNMHGRGMICK